MRDYGLDGLRGLASLNVVMAHFLLAFYPELLKEQYPKLQVVPVKPSVLNEVLSSFPLVGFYNGHFAVMIFFVISGYVLSLPYYDNKRDKLRSRLFFRFPRLVLPLVVVAMISYMMWSAGVYLNQTASLLAASKWISRFYNGSPDSTEFIREIFLVGESKFVPPGWTIQLEFWGSIILLGFYWLCSYGLHIIFIIPVAVVLWVVFRQDSIFIISMLSGSLLYYFNCRNRILQCVFVLLGIYFGCYSELLGIYSFLPDVHLFGFEIFRPKDLYNFFGAYMLVCCVKNDFGVSFFGWGLLRYLGAISYSMYLLHFIILCSLASFLYISLPGYIVHSVTVLVIYISSVVLVGSLFYMCVDRPVLALLKTISLRFDGFLNLIAVRSRRIVD